MMASRSKNIITVRLESGSIVKKESQHIKGGLSMAKKKKNKDKDEVKDNPKKNMCFTGYLVAFPKDAETKPTLEDFNKAINILTDADVVENCFITSMVMQVEVGEGGTMHLQGYVQLSKKMRRSTFNNLIRKHTPFNFSLKDARGNANQNVLYCTKPTGEWEYASGAKKMNTTLSAKPIWINKAGLVKKGERSDIKEAARAIENGTSMRIISQRFPTQFIRMGRGLRDLQFTKKAAESKEHRAGQLVVLYGDAGTGKSYDARTKIAESFGYSEEDVFSLQTDSQTIWFDGYVGEKILLLDDYEPNSMKRSTLLKLTDKYQFIGQVKGGHIVAEWELVIITTNSQVEELLIKSEWINNRRIEYPDPAFLSRITAAYDYNGMPDLRNGGTLNRIKMTDCSKVGESTITTHLGTWNNSLFQEPMRVQGATLPTEPEEAE
jgi:hypothetical protein